MMSDPSTYGAPQPAEWAQLAAISAQAFAGDEEQTSRWLQRLGRERVRAMRVDGRPVAGLLLYPMGQYFGRRRVPTWGVGGVSVAPESRGQGVGRAFMLSLLGEMREAGTPLCTLYPATEPLYRRLGWELGGSRVTYEADVGLVLPSRTPRAAAAPVELRELEEIDSRVVRQLYTSAAENRPGHLDRCGPIWERLKRPPPGSRVHGYLAKQSGRPTGYVVYVQQREKAASMKYTLAVRDLVFADAASGDRMLALLGQHRSVVDRVRLWGGARGPLDTLTSEQVLKPVDRFDWMVRIVDVARALEARGYPPSLRAAAKVRVEDDVLAENTDCYQLEVAEGACHVRRIASAECAIDIRGLASLYTGRLDPGELRRIGYLRGAEGQDELLQAMFAGPAPWLPDFF